MIDWIFKNVVLKCKGIPHLISIWEIIRVKDRGNSLGYLILADNNKAHCDILSWGVAKKAPIPFSVTKTEPKAAKPINHKAFVSIYSGDKTK